MYAGDATIDVSRCAINGMHHDAIVPAFKDGCPCVIIDQHHSARKT